MIKYLVISGEKFIGFKKKKKKLFKMMVPKPFQFRSSYILIQRKKRLLWGINPTRPISHLQTQHGNKSFTKVSSELCAPVRCLRLSAACTCFQAPSEAEQRSIAASAACFVTLGRFRCKGWRHPTLLPSHEKLVSICYARCLRLLFGLLTCLNKSQR